MPTLENSNCSSPAGWTLDQTDGQVDFNVLKAGKRCCRIKRTGPAGWNNLGARRGGHQLAAGHRLTWDHYFSGAGGDFINALTRADALNVGQCAGLNKNGSGSLSVIDLGASPGANTPSEVGWVHALAEVLESGALKFSWAPFGSNAWVEIGTTISTDWIGQTCWWGAQAHSGEFFFDQFRWTSENERREAERRGT